MSEKEINVLLHMMDVGKARGVGTYNKPLAAIADEARVSVPTVNRAVQKLKKRNLIIRYCNCNWVINPLMVANGNRQKQKVLERRYTGVQAEIEAKRKRYRLESAFPLWGWQALYSGGATYFAAETIGLYLRLDPTGNRLTVCAVQLGDMVHTDSLLIHFPDFCERVILWRRGEQVRK